MLPKPVDWDELYPGRFIKAGTFKGAKVTYTIAAVDVDELEGNKGTEVKGIISFEETRQQWCLNKTNGICLREMFGCKLSAWVGKRVTLFPTVYDGDPCIRVWGSPDIASDQNVTIKLPRKRPTTMLMHNTGGKAAAPTGSPIDDESFLQWHALLTEAPDKATLDKLLQDISATAGSFSPDQLNELRTLAKQQYRNLTEGSV